LIGNDDTRKTGGGQIAQGFDTTGQKNKLRPAFDIIGGVLIDRPVTVEKNHFF
jgi:hypothetical protein